MSFLQKLLALLGPVILEFLKEWFESRTAAIAKSLSRAKKLEGLSDGAKSRLVLEKLLAETPILQRRKRAFARAALQDIPPLIEAGKKKLPAKVSEELTGLAEDAQDD